MSLNHPHKLGTAPGADLGQRRDVGQIAMQRSDRDEPLGDRRAAETVCRYVGLGDDPAAVPEP